MLHQQVTISISADAAMSMIYAIIGISVVALVCLILSYHIFKHEKDIRVLDRTMIMPILLTSLIVIASFDASYRTFQALSMIIQFTGLISITVTFITHKRTNKTSISICLTALQYLLTTIGGFAAVLILGIVRELLT